MKSGVHFSDTSNDDDRIKRRFLAVLETLGSGEKIELDKESLMVYCQKAEEGKDKFKNWLETYYR